MATQNVRGVSRIFAATPGRTVAATLAADLRPNPEVLTQREPPPPRPPRGAAVPARRRRRTSCVDCSASRTSPRSPPNAGPPVGDSARQPAYGPRQPSPGFCTGRSSSTAGRPTPRCRPSSRWRPIRKQGARAGSPARGHGGRRPSAVTRRPVTTPAMTNSPTWRPASQRWTATECAYSDWPASSSPPKGPSSPG
jgi:hypothetical protein